MLEMRGSPEQEMLRSREPVRFGSPVVGHLMVVEARQEGAGGVRRLQIGIGLVESVAAPVVEKVDARKEALWHHAHRGLIAECRLRARELVDVIPVVKDKVQVL